ncbi:CDP-alcohol phosphatidyltransferase family protein [bacterium]|nr:CDP-alcohol phosphatidyltransferase family protein [bacterium]
MANLLTILRMILAILAVELIFAGNPSYCITALFLTFIVIVLDGLDGIVARAFHEESKFGSVFDIIGDRVVENIYWIAFAVIGWVSAWVPIIVVTRGIITDGLRSIALAQGYTAFGSSTMMKNKFFHFLTASRFSRAVYGTAKVLAFLMLIAAYMPNFEFYGGVDEFFFANYDPMRYTIANIADVLVYVTVAMCVIRGIPVILESKQYINGIK